MLTVKHQPSGGGESLLAQVVFVDYQPVNHRLVAYGMVPNGKVADKEVLAEYDNGHVYVTNDSGKTVGMYNLNTT